MVLHLAGQMTIPAHRWSLHCPQQLLHLFQHCYLLLLQVGAEAAGQMAGDVHQQLLQLPQRLPQPP